MKKLVLLVTMIFSVLQSQAQLGSDSNQGSTKNTIAVLSMDSRGINVENIPMGNLVRLELEKTQRYEVLDKYDVAHIMEEAGIDASTCFGKNQLIEAGKILEADNMLTGSVEKFGDKIIYSLRLIDVNGERIEKTSVIEFVYQLEDLQTMTTLIVNELLGIENDQVKYEMLVSFDRPITNSRTSLSLDGPRFGVIAIEGLMAQRLMDDKANGGLGLKTPFLSMFGYQWETQYISAGDFSALFEFIPAVNGIETGTPSFSLTILHGMRYNGWELGFGPAFRIGRNGEGYYDENTRTWTYIDDLPDGSELPLSRGFDNRAPVGLNTGLVIAVGKTISSGYLNFPINVYWSPSSQLETNTFGLILGFNIANSRPTQTPN